jgi:hypothetical protein
LRELCFHLLHHAEERFALLGQHEVRARGGRKEGQSVTPRAHRSGGSPPID